MLKYTNKPTLQLFEDFDRILLFIKPSFYIQKLLSLTHLLRGSV